MIARLVRMLRRPARGALREVAVMLGCREHRGVRYLITGATGYIGGRLAARLIDAGAGTVRCLVRDPDKLRDVPWAHHAEIVQGDLLDPASIRAACEDIDVLYFLVHSLSDRWRVEKLRDDDADGRILRLRAEMKVPGRSWLEMTVSPEAGGSRYGQRAVFIPRGLAGHLYWWSVAPFHGIVFGGMVRNITRTAERVGLQRKHGKAVDSA